MDSENKTGTNTGNDQQPPIVDKVPEATIYSDPSETSSLGTPQNWITEKSTTQIPGFWKVYAVILGILSIGPLALFMILLLALSQAASNGASGTEFGGLGALPLLLLGGAASFVSSISAIVFLVRYRPTGKRLAVPIAAIVLGLLTASFIVIGYLSFINHEHFLANQSYQSNSIR